MVNATTGGGGYNPASWLYEPVPAEAIPSTFDAALGMADWLSLGHWALVVLDKADGGFDLQEKAQTWLAGDWQRVATSAAAMRNLKGFCESMSGAVDSASAVLDQHWDGNAWRDAQATMVSHSVALEKAAGMLEIAAKGYDDVANGLYGVAKDVGNVVQTLIDLLIAAGISAAATAGGSWTLVGGAIGAAATYWGITEIISNIQKIIGLIEGAMTIVDVLVDTVSATMGSAGDWHLVDIPDAFDNNVAPSGARS
ncbi:hypothetical protein KMZ32_14075 [Phycicoccus sp. MAQZ13P-2]|uniref:hypothetical protein n=1 Tax=Phycicoccus mangrovi TaxID=2840470 RepID=UPI001C0031C6|nr:hypothetical protein [Phycicoccus mangrovi]MBT9256552.1 hypothetical protein [Phycicoccus mangrovi]MBT9275200.1 hypothetical protein [Phycicoccus mangrovi]